MISELDEALRQLLVDELPIRDGEIDIKFEQPNREWSARLSRPTLNLFLYDVRENVKLRQPSPQWIVEQRTADTVTQRRRPVRLDLNYAITAWAREPEDEHRLLARTLMVLFRNPYLPEDQLDGQPSPVSILAAQNDAMMNPADFWSAMDNEIRPVISCTVTLALDPYQPVVAPITTGRAIRFLDTDTDEEEPMGQELWRVSGTLLGSRPMRRVRMLLVEEEQQVPVNRDGQFTIRGLKAGEYTLEITIADKEPVRHTIVVPSSTYELEV